MGDLAQKQIYLIAIAIFLLNFEISSSSAGWFFFDDEMIETHVVLNDIDRTS